MRPLGTGLIYNPELDALFREGHPDLSVLELEPETLWDRTFPMAAGGSPVYRPNQEALRRIAGLPQRKLIHSVGFPVGGSVPHGEAHLQPLAEVVEQMQAPWVSEHLSFNTIATNDGVQQVGFLLPPRQTAQGVAVAAANIRQFKAAMPRPFAFETGVNYLRPRHDELSDGAFFAAVAGEADCGILLDLHNLWVNERNGRQRVFDALAAMPLERVWEVHLAGGMMLGDHYLDSHSDPIPPQLLEIAAQVIPMLPNMGALLFEMLPGFVAQNGTKVVRDQLPLLRDLWKLRPARSLRIDRSAIEPGCLPSGTANDVGSWEHQLGIRAIGHVPAAGSPFQALERDPGMQVLNTLIDEFRSGRISRALRFTLTLLLLGLGPVAVRELLQQYHRECFPDVFTSGEADRFAQFLRARLSQLPAVPYIADVLAFEHALIRATLYGAGSRIDWSCDPAELFEVLESGRMPQDIPRMQFSMDIQAT